MSPPPSPSPSIGHAMNTATRPLHTTLNRLITSLLSLSLPPHTTTPTLYAHGMHSILSIYSAFESIFTNLLSCPPPTLSPRMRHLLQTLHIPALSRTARLHSDLSLLLPIPSLLPDTQHGAQKGDKLQAFLAHIHASTAARPHLLLAYTWNLYMALFSGGRHLRSQLRASGIFADGDGGLSFWGFDGEQDGEDLRTEYKARVAGVEALLSPEERDEVVGEGVLIMGFLVEVVRELEREIPARMGGGAEVRAGGDEGGGLGSVQGAVLGMVASWSRSVVERLGWPYGNAAAAAAANPLA